MSLRDKITAVIEEKLCPIFEEKRDPNRRFYFRSYRDNLIRGMDPQHVGEYGGGSGGEMTAKGKRPAKMASIASSSAMTFNILGNCTVDIKPNFGFTPGSYSVKYEKQMPTLNKGSNPANLDAFLYNLDEQEAIFCEMKMLEWLGKPGVLKAAYLKKENYFNAEAFEVFSKIAEAMQCATGEEDQDAYASCFAQYDAWQMFKHTLAIYNATSKYVEGQLDEGDSMNGWFKKITLANVVFEMDESIIDDERIKEKYMEAEQCEHAEADRFIEIMMDPAYGLEDLFRKHCGVEFDIKYISVHDFVRMLDKDGEELAALKRYCCC